MQGRQVRLRAKFTSVGLKNRYNVRMDFEFRHQAMGCEFRLVAGGLPEQILHDVAVEVWELVDRLDSQLSHYNERSEISYINARAACEPVLVEPDLMDLLLFARDMWILTDQALDITMGMGAAGFENVTLDYSTRLIAFAGPNVGIELGALGKGYAIDAGVRLLQRYDVPVAMLSAGGSSAYGYGAEWPLRILDPLRPQNVLVEDQFFEQGISTSGPCEQPEHLIWPETREPSESPPTATVRADTALEAEALSTAIAVSWRPKAMVEWVMAYLRESEDLTFWIIKPEEECTWVTEMWSDKKEGGYKMAGKKVSADGTQEEVF